MKFLSQQYYVSNPFARPQNRLHYVLGYYVSQGFAFAVAQHSSPSFSSGEDTQGHLCRSETVEVHHLVPRRHKVADEATVVACVELSDRPEPADRSQAGRT